ncbi:acyl-CoA dehydrogenase [Cryobacterium sp. TMT1-21]|uniref:Acyl-CoA dehydrogenase n=1 Tax=Cryobacterium shii TaxID=1259235 RepID=A0AAQ2C5Q3_9MICO|nr:MULTISPECIES: acyl-CoA dehydrogenase family protein [Cryobacterium]TFC46431.1 acyl-CoA dehydrogenase [Cryobacterium shii]TFC80751.1 acyl-CoA dehydrogenase [Cryobacterium sp. TmT2-59]TFD17350.1 acyl-CoA dehydrogenase [Cryobacterium sp. TMT1-21]TFD20359.1 acyl-CoA dehydrogenase [Cryobacterium sp. TMT2-23]TFD22371.1 acyl-CoA dehydrogenase [Cryobacterium sp. TMT4-10]
MTPASPSPLGDELLLRIRSRAAGHDRDNTFPTDDLADLTAAGYLRALVPVEFGGLGRSLNEVARDQIRLAAHAPATALAVNMHLVWTGVARTLHARGDDSLAFVLHGAAACEVFGFGVSEPGNDLVLSGSITAASPQADGGYRFTGTKIFTTLSPAWTRLGTMGLDTESPDAPKIVWAFIDRTDPGVSQKDDWDTLGMRASQSRSTVLSEASARPDRVFRRLDPGPNPDPLLFAIFANFEILLAAVYTGIGRRAVELAVDAAGRRTSLKNDGRTLAQDPDIRWRVADAAMLMDGLYPQVDALAHDVDAGVDRGRQWFPLLSGLKHRATETARQVVDQALRVSGGSSYFAGNELGRLYRDVLAGIFHPSDAESAHATVAAAWLGPLDV